MRKRLFLLAFFFPVTVNAGYIDKEVIEAGHVQLGGTIYSSSGDVTSDMAPFEEREGTVSEYGADLELISGIYPTVNIRFAVSPVGKEIQEATSSSNISYREEREGLGDLLTELRFRLSPGDSYPVINVGVVLPTGDDSDPGLEVKGGSELLSPGIAGGRGNGRTDYRIGAGYYYGSTPAKLFFGTEYMIRGKANGRRYGNVVNISGQASFPIGPAVSLVGGVGFQMTNDTANGAVGHTETSPRVMAELGGMYSVSNKTELIATIGAVSCGKEKHFDELDTVYATVEYESAIEFALTVRSRF